MRALLTRISVRRSGSVARREEVLEAEPIRVGRAASNEISLDGLSVSLHHADLVRRAGGIYLVPQPPATVLHRGRRAAGEIRVRPGDAVQIGTYELRIVETDRADVDVALELESTAPRSSELEELHRRSRLGIESGFWTRTRIAWVTTSGVVALCLLFPLWTARQGSWSTGPVSNGHASIAEDCSACHRRPFESVRSDVCLDCHAGIGSHAGDPPFAAVDELNCSDCHLEHGGAEGLAELSDRRCASCHADLGSRFDSEIEPASDFAARHPEFTLHLLQPPAATSPEAEPGVQRVPWSPDARESSGLTFNHRTHVGGVRMADSSRGNLRCDACHVVDEGGRRMEPIRFEEHCRSCHTLNFARGSNRLRAAQAAHGEPGELRRQLRLAFLGDALPREPGETEPERDRRRLRFMRPGAQRTPEEKRLLEEVERKTDQAFELLMSKDYCGLCHTLLPEESERPIDVAPIALTRAWFGEARFDHSSHATTPCSRCHARATVHDEEYAATAGDFVRSPGTGRGDIPYELLPTSELRRRGIDPSESSVDVLVPGRGECRTCHGGSRAQPPEVASPCLMCHPYHRAGGPSISDRLAGSSPH